MSVKVSSYVWDGLRGNEWGGSKKLLMLALADWSNDDGGSIYPSISRIAAKICSSESQARRLLRELEEDDFIKVVGNHNGGKPGTTRQYQLNVTKLEELSDSYRQIDKQLKVEKARVASMRGVSPTTGVAPVRKTGRTHATQSISEPPTSTTPRGKSDFSTEECVREETPGDDGRWF